MNYGEALKEIRQDKNLTLLEVEKATGISNANICRWENGKAIPGIEFCIKLAKFYNCTLDELVGFTNEINSNSENVLSAQPKKSVSAFDNEFKDILSDKNFVQTAKLFNAITPELRALSLGYLVGLLQSRNIDTAKILNY